MFSSPGLDQVNRGPIMPDARLGPTLQRDVGACEVRFDRDREGATRLRHVYQHAPCRVLFPRPEPGELPTAVLLTTSGGLAGGDRLRVAVAAEAGAQALVTAQAAEKIYRARAADAETTVELSLRAEAGAWLEYLPQETILFDGARLRRDTVIEVAVGGRLLAGEFVVLGRSAHGEAITAGLLHDRWQVRWDGRLVWVDALRLGGADGWQVRSDPAGLAGATALFTLIYVAEDALAQLELVRGLIATLPSKEVRAGATVLGPVLIVRLLGLGAGPLRRTVARVWTGLRAEAAALPAVLPRLWSI